MLVGKRAAYFPCCFGICADMVLELAINVDHTFISSVKNSFVERTFFSLASFHVLHCTGNLSFLFHPENFTYHRNNSVYSV